MPASVSATPGEQSEPGSDAAPRTELPARPFSPLTCIRPSAAPRIVRSPNPSHGSGSNCGRSNPGCGAGSTYRFPRRCWPCVTSSVGWADSHLFEFVIGDRVYGEPLPDDDFWDRHVYKTAGIRLKTLSSVAWSASSTSTTSPTTGGTTSSSNRSAIARPTSTTQRSSAAASGGARRRTSASPASCSCSKRRSTRSTWSNEVLTWYGKLFDPDDIDERWVRLRLATLAARWRGALAQH